MAQLRPADAPPVEEIAQVLALHPIFGRFDPTSLRAVAAHCGFATFPAGDTIMRQGDRGTFACVILEGEVDVSVEIPAGLIHVATLGRNRFIGELGVFTDLPRIATVVARTYVIVLRIDRDSLMSLAAEFPSIGVAPAAQHKPLAGLSDLRGERAGARRI